MLTLLLDLYSIIVLVAVVISWMQLPPGHPIARFVHSVTEPVLDPVRRALPPRGGLDFSPMVLLIGLRMVRSLF